jgi:hypothetical protein
LFSFFALVYRKKLDKSCVLLVFLWLIQIVDHGGRRGNTARALARWQHLVASLHEAMDALHRAMRIAPYRPGSMAIEIVVDSPAFFVIVDSIVAHNHS